MTTTPTTTTDPGNGRADRQAMLASVALAAELPADRRAMLALIALATDLPVPRAIHLYADSSLLCLDLDGLAEGLAWSAFLGGDDDSHVYNGHRYLREGVIRWRGWSVQLHASDPVPRPGEARCGDRLCGADGGACPTCGYDARQPFRPAVGCPEGGLS